MVRCFVSIAVMCSISTVAHGQQWITLRYPGSNETYAHGVSGNNTVGWYVISGHAHGFLYDGSSYTALNYPGATDTAAFGISGNTIVENTTATTRRTGLRTMARRGRQLTTQDRPRVSAPLREHAWRRPLGWRFLARHTIQWYELDIAELSGVNRNLYSRHFGNNSVGNYYDGNGARHGFLHDGTNWTALNYPGGSSTTAYGMSGGNIVGNTLFSGWSGFIYNNGTGWSAPMKYPGRLYQFLRYRRRQDCRKLPRLSAAVRDYSSSFPNLPRCRCWRSVFASV